jgi:hypothetical protein
MPFRAPLAIAESEIATTSCRLAIVRVMTVGGVAGAIGLS